MNKRYKTRREIPFEDIYPLNDQMLCRRCEKPLTGRQKSWCSKNCSNIAFDHVMFVRGSSKHIRMEVFVRDRGVCAVCGVNSEILQKISDAARSSIYEDALDKFIEIRGELQAKHGPFEAYRIGEQMKTDYLKFARRLWRITSLNFGSSCWHADHIVELCNGGENSLENLQTLCVLCHKAKTKKLFRK